MITNHKFFKVFLGTLLLYSVVLFSTIFFGNQAYIPTDSLGWSAVFLSDGQVYFGHLEKENKAFVRLTQVYYLKYGTSLQQDRNGISQTSSSNLNLVKLGGEVHAPKDFMFIAKDKILFIETLKDSSQVVQAIKKNI